MSGVYSHGVFSYPEATEKKVKRMVEAKVGRILERLECRREISIYLGDQQFYWLENEFRILYIRMLTELLIKQGCLVERINKKPLLPKAPLHGKVIVKKEQEQEPKEDSLLYHIPGLGTIPLT